MKSEITKTSKYAKRARKQEQRRKLTPLESRFEPLCVFFDRISDFLPLFLSGSGALLLSVYSLFVSWWHTVGLWCGITAASAGLVTGIIRSTILSDLEKNIAELKTQQALLTDRHSGEIEQLRTIIEVDKNTTYQVLDDAANDLYDELNLRGHATRLSLYFHEKESQSFARIARVSDNPSLLTTGRTSYSNKQGFIAQVWNNKSGYVSKMPKTRDIWVRPQVDRYGFTIEEAENLTMHTRCIVGVRLDYRNQPVGILIVESEESESLEAVIDTLNGSPVCAHTLPRLFVASKIALGKNS